MSGALTMRRLDNEVGYCARDRVDHYALQLPGITVVAEHLRTDYELCLRGLCGVVH